MTMVRTRIAPAACTYLSLGELQATLLNWLFARSKGGKFLVRIGEMDLVRGRAETVHRILDDIQWLEVDWDEGPDIGGSHGPYLQSERRDLYAKALEKISASDRVYAYAPERDGEPAAEGGAEEIAAWTRSERPFVFRYRLDRSGKVEVRDMVRGSIEVSLDDVEDPIVRRHDGSASPFMAQVIDDAEMRITHVLKHCQAEYCVDAVVSEGYRGGICLNCGNAFEPGLFAACSLEHGGREIHRDDARTTAKRSALLQAA